MTEINQKGILEPNDLERNLKIESEYLRQPLSVPRLCVKLLRVLMTIICENYYRSIQCFLMKPLYPLKPIKTL